MKIPSLLFLVRATGAVVRRFPLVAAAAMTAVIALMGLTENEQQPVLVKLWMMGQLGVPLFTGLHTFAESRGWQEQNWRRWAVLAGGLLLLAVYYALLPDPLGRGFGETEGVRFVGILLAAHLVVAVAPYLNQLRIADFWAYNKQLFAAWIVGAVFTVILWGGLSLALLALERLFKVDIRETLYVHMFILLAGLFHSAYLLHHLPRQYAEEATDTGYNAVFKNLCKYILIPIVGLYFLILYAYAARILVTWELPQGWISSLVIGFSVAGIFTYLLNYQLPLHDPSPIVRNYRRWFWWILLPMVALLMVAIYRRIDDFGVTPQRFMVATIAVWLLVNGLYFAISRTDNIKFIPLTLALFALFSVLGPFNAFVVSQRSQMGILEDLLIKNNRMLNGKIVTPQGDFTGKDAQRVTDIFYWLDQRDALGLVQPWLDEPLDSLPAAPKGNYGRVGRLTHLLGIRSARDDYSNLVRVAPNGLVNNGNIRGYQTWYRVEADEYMDPPGIGRYFVIDNNGSGLVYRERHGSRYEDLDRIDFRPKMKEWLESDLVDDAVYLPANSETFDFNGRRIEARIVVEELELRPGENGGEPALMRFRGLVFIKDKIK
ncbi:MAG: DUF4153 domain-containing protein [Saprospiraceae bacterium]|nr:DUF4153 domain-containing protein [Saprospiraceae bacterium]